jgi:hypothetical protein
MDGQRGGRRVGNREIVVMGLGMVGRGRFGVGKGGHWDIVEERAQSENFSVLEVSGSVYLLEIRLV